VSSIHSKNPNSTNNEKKFQQEVDLSCHRYITKPDDYHGTDTPLITPCNGYRIELGGTRSEITQEDLLLERQEKNSLYYQEHFYGKVHSNYIGGDENNPMIVSITLDSNDGHCYAIIRTKHDDFHVVFSPGKSKGKLIQCLSKDLPELMAHVKFKEIKDDHFPTKLLHMEDRLLVKAYKFGVIYCKAGQTSEDEMFCNSDPSVYFTEFLNLLGNTIPLKSYQGYKGGLDVDNDTTGTHSVITNIAGFEVMYHVSTMLPATENATQVERKRHIGNDVVVIIFQDGPAPFNPGAMLSKFNHVYAVVQVDPEATTAHGKTYYKFGIASKEGVVPHGPVLPANPLFECGPFFREFLLTKLINAERAAYYAPGFGQTRTRRLWMKGILEQYGDSA